jgi:molybdate transport system substrate-binding protein
MRLALLSAGAAGIHFAKVLRSLGLGEAPGRRFHRHENGAAAMRALARSESRAIGCTQVTEILYTPGVVPAGPLPEPFGLRTEYAAGLCRDCAPAQQFLALLTGASSAAQRREAGFETA